MSKCTKALAKTTVRFENFVKECDEQERTRFAWKPFYEFCWSHKKIKGFVYTALLMLTKNFKGKRENSVEKFDNKLI